MRSLAASIFAVGALAICGSADAATAVIKGTLVTEGPGPNVDPNLALGDVLTASIQFDPKQAIKLGTTGYSVARMQLTLKAGAFNLPFSDLNDGDPFFIQSFETLCPPSDDPDYCSFEEPSYFLSAPAVIFSGSRIYGLLGTSAINDPIALSPDYDLGSNISDESRSRCVRVDYNSPYHCTYNIENLIVSDNFYITSYGYNDTYHTQGFTGLWDFSSAQVSGIPEPATWALLIAGFGMTGIVLRRNAKTAAQA